MEITERTVNGVTILDLKGKITLGDGDEHLRDAIARVLASGHTHLLLNLAGVDYLKLLNLTKRIEDLLSITKLLTVFETFDTEADAVASFGA